LNENGKKFRKIRKFDINRWETSEINCINYNLLSFTLFLVEIYINIRCFSSDFLILDHSFRTTNVKLKLKINFQNDIVFISYIINSSYFYIRKDFHNEKKQNIIKMKKKEKNKSKIFLKFSKCYIKSVNPYCFKEKCFTIHKQLDKCICVGSEEDYHTYNS